jgi:hypothetical protein
MDEKLYAYEIVPIDFGFEHLRHVDEHRKALASRWAEATESDEREDAANACVAFDAFHKSALEAASGVGWEGDFRNGPYVGFIPDEGEMATYFVWKQDNNGTTYVVTPIEMPWLDRLT